VGKRGEEGRREARSVETGIGGEEEGWGKRAIEWQLDSTSERGLERGVVENERCGGDCQHQRETLGERRGRSPEAALVVSSPLGQRCEET